MGKKVLVDADIEAGYRLYKAVEAEGFYVAVAAWLRLSEEPELKLYLAMPEIEKIGPFAIYTEIRKILEAGTFGGIVFDDVVVVNARNHFVMTLAATFNVNDYSVIRITNLTVYDMRIDEMVLYAPSKHLARFEGCAQALSEFAL